MLRPDFCEIYEVIAKMGFLLTVYTNATMVTDKVMEVLRKYPPHKIGVTMYGATNETYEKMCGCVDGYDRFIEGIRKLSTLPSAFEIRTTIIKDNLQDLQAMKRFVKQEFNQTLTINRFVTDAVRGGIACPKECRLSPEDNVTLTRGWFVDLYQKVKNGEVEVPKEGQRLQTKHYLLPDEGNYLFESCGAGIQSYVISWSGEMYACELLQKGCTYPVQDGFIEAWKQLPDRYPKSKIVKVCAECDYAPVCSSCPAQRLAETGDWFGVPEYACGEAKFICKMLQHMKVI